MTKSYSLDLRRRVARFVEAGHSCHAAARHFEVSVAFVVRLMAACRATGSLAAQPEGGWRYSKLDPHREFLLQRVASRQMPHELTAIGYRAGLGGADLARASRLIATVDTAAIQDGSGLYLHSFIDTDDGQWTVVQQGQIINLTECRATP